jgi:chemotaxis protein methyltransferase CheR
MSLVPLDIVLPQVIVDTIREPLLVLDGDLRVVAASRSFYAKFKVDRENVEGRPLHTLGNGQWDITALADKLKTIAPEDGVLEGFEVALAFPEIGQLTMLLNARKLFYKRGENVTILLAFEDVTDLRLDEQERDRLLREKELLLDEMQHRVANSLQIIAGILLMKARAFPSEDVRLHLHDAHKRVLAVAAVQRHLRPTIDHDTIAMRPYLTELCASLAGSMISDRVISINPRIDAATEKSATAASIGLIVTELVINALKHAFPVEGPNHSIDVAYSNTAAGWRLTVSDNGAGKAEAGPSKSKGGLGANIVAALAKQLNAHVDTQFNSAGTSVSVINVLRKPNTIKGVGAAAPLRITRSLPENTRNRKEAEA